MGSSRNCFIFFGFLHLCLTALQRYATYRQSGLKDLVTDYGIKPVNQDKRLDTASADRPELSVRGIKVT
jgi:hypothetical protein